MKAFQETTEWDTDFAMPNHVYFLSDSKDKMYGYVKAGTGEILEVATPYKFKASGRKFKEVINTWGFFPREELVPIGETHRVAGSKGAVYTVTNDRGSWSCTCPASKWQAGECKHIRQLNSNTVSEPA
jgi:hypothetical protein